MTENGRVGQSSAAQPRQGNVFAIAKPEPVPPDTKVITETITLWRPVGPAELDLIRASGMTAFPPRLPHQPIFYPVTTEDYAIKIARDWNVPASGSGFVTRFEVRRDYFAGFEVQDAGGRAHREYWIPAEDLPAFNAAIVGEIAVVHEFR